MLYLCHWRQVGACRVSHTSCIKCVTQLHCIISTISHRWLHSTKHRILLLLVEFMLTEMVRHSYSVYGMLQLVASVAECNRIAQMLQLIPPSAVNAAGFDYEMKPDLTRDESIRFETSILVCLE